MNSNRSGCRLLELVIRSSSSFVRSGKQKSLKPTTAARSFQTVLPHYTPLSVDEMETSKGTPAVKQPEWIPPKGVERPKLRLYNSLTRRKDVYVSVHGKTVGWYSCGPTVYDASHMGHARNYVSTDIARRILENYFGYDVLFVQNVTDIDDKIIIRGRQTHLFEEFVKGHPTINPDLIADCKVAWDNYAKTNLKVGEGAAPDVSPKLDSLKSFDDFALILADFRDIPTLAAEAKNPKLPMHIKSLREAHAVILKAESDPTSIEISTFLKAVEDVLVPILDEKLGASITDPAIFRNLAAYWEHQFNKDMASLNVLSPSVVTRVSEYVPQIVEYVNKMVENGYAYAGGDSVYFDTQMFEKNGKHHYAKLQPWNRGQKALIDEGEGSLSTSKSGKKNPSDFALWKGSKPGEPSWPSPWGAGRPGWHIECSVMASAILGTPIDIHSGGIDLAFPHHDNELAQSEAYYDCQQWVNYFLHTGHLHIEGLKMSKSLKNFITIQDALKKYTPRQLRLAFALQQWNNPFDFKESLMVEVRAYESSISKFFSNVRAFNLEEKMQELAIDDKAAAEAGTLPTQRPTNLGHLELALLMSLRHAQEAVEAAFCDNLSTPTALTVISEVVSNANIYISKIGPEYRAGPVTQVALWVTKIFGILGFQVSSSGIGWKSEDEDTQSSSGSTSSHQEIALPYVRALSRFRDDIRREAIAKAPVSVFLGLCDRVRDNDLIDLGVALDDRAASSTGEFQSALVKILSSDEKEQLQIQRQEKIKAQQEKAAKKQALEKERKLQEQQQAAKGKINPKIMFKGSDNGGFSEYDGKFKDYDEEGLPTLDSQGEPISKSLKKKLMKIHEGQKKLFKIYNSLNH